jgi:16S rRNA (cytidine1402-2'-O)-methyltransferase
MELRPGTGTLWLIPSVLGDTPAAQVLPEETLLRIRSLDHFIVEEIRTARRFLRAAGGAKNLDAVTFYVFNEHSHRTQAEQYMDLLLQGTDVGLLSEAGVPCVADPGSEIVAAAHRAGIRVIPLTGPSSILLALMASGFWGQKFAFHGYLPVEKGARSRRIRELEREAGEKGQTQIFIETPYRNLQLLEALSRICQPETLICVAAELTTQNQSVTVRPASAWRDHLPDLHKKPAVFLLAGGEFPRRM